MSIPPGAGTVRRGRRPLVAAGVALCAATVASTAAAAPDRSPPSVSWSAPASGQTVSGTLSGAACEVTARDNVGVARVEFFAGSRRLGTDTSAPYRCTLDTRTLSNGAQTLRAVAYDRAGNAGSASRSITVSNVTTPTPTWQLAFSDDFNGGAVDTSRWFMYDGPGHNGNGLRRPSAFSVTGGNLVITAQMVGGQLVSGGMAHMTNYTYGRFEARVRTEPDAAGATTGVVLTWPQSERWPADGENDIYQTYWGSASGAYYTALLGTDNVWYRRDLPGSAADWHTVALEWEPAQMRVYLDGALMYTLSNASVIPQVPHHLCLQLDAMKTSMTGSKKMYVDFVRIYRAT